MKPFMCYGSPVPVYKDSWADFYSSLQMFPRFSTLRLWMIMDLIGSLFDTETQSCA